MAVYFNNHCHRDVVIAFHDGVDLAKAYFVKYNDGMYLVTLVHSNSCHFTGMYAEIILCDHKFSRRRYAASSEGP